MNLACCRRLMHLTDSSCGPSKDRGGRGQRIVLLMTIREGCELLNACYHLSDNPRLDEILILSSLPFNRFC